MRRRDLGDCGDRRRQITRHLGDFPAMVGAHFQQHDLRVCRRRQHRHRAADERIIVACGRVDFEITFQKSFRVVFRRSFADAARNGDGFAQTLQRLQINRRQGRKTVFTAFRRQDKSALGIQRAPFLSIGRRFADDQRAPLREHVGNEAVPVDFGAAKRHKPLAFLRFAAVHPNGQRQLPIDPFYNDAGLQRQLTQSHRHRIVTPLSSAHFSTTARSL